MKRCHISITPNDEVQNVYHTHAIQASKVEAVRLPLFLLPLISPFRPHCPCSALRYCNITKPTRGMQFNFLFSPVLDTLLRNLNFTGAVKGLRIQGIFSSYYSYL
jgi:hypothetical protein